MPQTQTFHSQSEQETRQIGVQVAQQLCFPSCVYFQGDLGVGKTMLSKSIIQSLGYDDIVTSPTYNLIQNYPVNGGMVYHMDLYRLQDPEEIEFLGLSDLWGVSSVFLIEWPDKAHGLLPPATHVLKVSNVGVFFRKIELLSY